MLDKRIKFIFQQQNIQFQHNLENGLWGTWKGPFMEYVNSFVAGQYDQDRNGQLILSQIFHIEFYQNVSAGL
jgi:hypothetical protein